MNDWSTLSKRKQKRKVESEIQQALNSLKAGGIGITPWQAWKLSEAIRAIGNGQYSLAANHVQDFDAGGDTMGHAPAWSSVEALQQALNEAAELPSATG